MKVNMMTQQTLSKWGASVALILLSKGGFAQPTIATVNDVAVPAVLLEQVVKNNARQDIQDTPELRQVIRNELILREVLSQEAIKKGLDKTDAAKNQWLLLRQNFLAELLISDYLEKNPVSNDDVRKEYDRQVQQLVGVQQYKISNIVTTNEADAKAVMARLRKGERFEAVAKEMSLDPSKQQGGDMGWLLVDQIIPLVANVIVNMAKGATVTAPIQTPTGWHVIRLDDTRLYAIPSFDESKERVRQGLLLQKRAALIKKLQSEAKIVTSS